MRVEWVIARAEFAAGGMNRSAAELYGSIAETLAEARAHPDVWISNGFQAVPTDATDFAVRAAVMDVAVRLGIAESTVRAYAQVATTLQKRLPRLWEKFVDGRVPIPNARAAAEMVGTMPDPSRGDPAEAGLLRSQFAQFDSRVVDDAARMSPGRFRTKLRAVLEEVNPQTMDERHEIAKVSRRMWVEHEPDSMALIGVQVPSDVAHRASAHVHALAEQLKAREGESRTLDQLRADVAGDLLMGGSPADGGVAVSVSVTIPMLTLLGVENRPATMDGLTPIPAAKARELAALAPSLRRLLTDPVTSAVLDFDTNRYRPTADLRRMVELTSPLCSAPGCGRRSRECDLDHIVAHEHHGPTNLRNLTPLCRGHHRLKHVSRWRADRTATGSITWTRPTGHTRTADPPPF